jgi:hypothetical protein
MRVRAKGNRWNFGTEGEALYARLVRTNSSLEVLHLPCEFVDNTLLTSAMDTNYSLHELGGCSFTVGGQAMLEAALRRNSLLLWCVVCWCDVCACQAGAGVRTHTRHKMHPLLVELVWALLPLRVSAMFVLMRILIGVPFADACLCSTVDCRLFG